MLLFRPRLSLFLFALLCVSASVPTVALGILQARSAEADALAQFDAESSGLARAVARDLTTWLKTNLSSVDALQTFVRTAPRYGVPVDAVLRDHRTVYPDFYSCFLAGTHGRSTVADPPLDSSGQPSAGKDYSAREYFQRVRDSLQPVISRPIIGKINARPAIAVAVPQLDAQGQFAGMTACALELAHLQDRAETLVRHGNGLKVVVLDDAGRAVVHPDETARLELRTVRDQGLFAAVTGPEPVEVREGLDAHGVPSRGAAVRIDELGLQWTVVVARPSELAAAATGRVRRQVATTIVIALLFIMVLAARFARTLARPIEDLRRTLLAVARGQLSVQTPDIRPLDPHEVAELMTTTGHMASELRARSHQLVGVTDGVTAAIERIATTGDRAARATWRTSDAINAADVSMLTIARYVDALSDQVDGLAGSADETAHTVAQMAQAQQQTQRAVTALSQNVRETTAAVRQVVDFLRELASTVENISAATGSTNQAMAEMDVSINKVQDTARHTRALSDAVITAAQKSMGAVTSTVKGIGDIRDSASEAARRLEALKEHGRAAGSILDVIDTVARQTNMLAFNAAIIASQAGAQGAGFAVIADEIKRLAQMTSDSTKEVSDIIAAVQEGAQSVMDAMNSGLQSVAAGVQLGHQAEDALRDILRASEEARRMVLAISEASEVQTRRSSEVVRAMKSIDATMHQTADEAAHQSHGASTALQSSEQMARLTADVEKSAAIQADGALAISKAMQHVMHMVEALQTAHQEQRRGSQQVQSAVVAIRGVVEEQAQSVRELERTLDALRDQAGVLKGEIDRFGT